MINVAFTWKVRDARITVLSIIVGRGLPACSNYTYGRQPHVYPSRAHIKAALFCGSVLFNHT